MSELEAVVFVVDDDASVRTSTERLVRSIGFRVQTFVSAREFLTKPYRRQALIDAVRGAIERDRIARRERRDATALRERYEHLTPREREVMGFVVAGVLNKQIAAELDTTERTIKFHRAHIMEKMAAASLPDLVRMAAQLDGEAKR